MIEKEKIRAYNKERPVKARNLLCHAPFTNLNFEQNGNITACCYNRSYVLGRYPEQTLEEVWFGKKAEQLRQYIRENNLSGGCSACEQLLNSGNYRGTKAMFYDEYADTVPLIGRIRQSLFGRRSYPKVLEFEISNVCNLECTMCNGYFSSAIRKNREHLPELTNPYDDDFVRQIKTFIPHLTDAKFLGGEPFLIDVYYGIWDSMIETNSRAKAHITTNGTILNGRAKDYLEKLNCGIILSLDSLNKTTYEKIRVNANHARVMDNMHYFMELARKKNSYFSIAACPIRDNWADLPELVRFCNEHNIYLHFNTVWTPESESLNFLSPDEFREVISFLEANGDFSRNTATRIHNYNNYQGVINQIKFWEAQRVLKVPIKEENRDQSEAFFSFSGQELSELPKAELNILLAEMAHYAKQAGKHQGANSFDLVNSGSVIIDPGLSLDDNLQLLHKHFGPEIFLNSYCHCLSLFAGKVLPDPEASHFASKTESLRLKFEQVRNKSELVSELTRTGFLYLFDLVRSENMDTIFSLIEGRFS